MKFKFLYVFIIFFISCENNTIDLHIKEANEFRIKKEFGKAVVELKKAEKLFNNNKRINEIIFLLGEIYLNDIKDYNYAIEQFKKINKNSSLYSKAIFMIGYIYSNNLNEYSQAIKYYELFTKNFPKHELFPSVKYELDQLDPYRGVIDSLNAIAKIRMDK